MKKLTPKERIDKRRQARKRNILDALVIMCAIAGVILAEPWQAFRRGEAAVFVSPENLLEVLFSVMAGIGVIYAAQEFGRTDSVKAQKRILNRCIMAFFAGAGIGGV